MVITIDQLRRNLDGFIDRAQAGESFEIQNVNGVYVQLCGSSNTLNSKLQTAVEAGQIIMPLAVKHDTGYRPVNAPGKLASDMVIEDRR
jgi:antitoxin (DNA-binding transcriptional repressor) of toxin-antitoxin stability system